MKGMIIMEKFVIAIGSDHKGFNHKKSIIEYLEKNGYKVLDFGPFNEDSVDYPDYATKVCKSVQTKEANYGILICYTGIGMSIVANKHNSIRAALVGSVENAKLTRNHNNANVLCIGAKDTNIELTLEIVEKFISESFAGERHTNRVNKITEVELNEKR